MSCQGVARAPSTIPQVADAQVAADGRRALAGGSLLRRLRRRRGYRSSRVAEPVVRPPLARDNLISKFSHNRAAF